ncbi:PEP-CTERM sorting domain-containing protein [Gloeothece verrucosa]|nr:PEP-CTERM sorting domain-containing protein [Gloeothece verrucosa]
MNSFFASRFWGSIGIASALALTWLPLMPKAAQAATYTFTAGNMDAYNTSDGLEPSNPSPGAVAFINNLYSSSNISCTNNPLCQIRNFDQPGADRQFIHTFSFSNLIGNITGANLEIRVRASAGGSQNDAIHLLFIDSLGNLDPVRWGSYFGSGNGTPSSSGTISTIDPSPPSNSTNRTSSNQTSTSTVPGLLNTSWTASPTPVDQTFYLDLSSLSPLALPNTTGNLIATLNTKGFLDVYVQDDTEVDYIKLTVETVPEPFTILGAGVALGFGSLFKRQKAKK